MDETQGSGVPPPAGGPRPRAAKTQAGPRVIYQSVPLTPDDIVDTTVALSATYERHISIAGVCVADGYGVRLTVNRGALVVEDGAGPHRRTRRYERATHGLKRLVVIGGTGVITLDALDWCKRLGVGVLVLDAEGAPVFTSVPRSTDDARLRRVQAMAPDSPVGLHLARLLLARKLLAQSALITGRFSVIEASESIAELSAAVSVARSVAEARQLEASAAALYWQSWANRPECVPSFNAKDRSRVPPHWIRYEGRRSVLASSNANRKAERPVNALLNYAYALLEAETILACQVVGLDPGLGIVHNDTRARQSLALDIMEPVRPVVDGLVLDMLIGRTFRKAEFVETSDGHCRLRAPLTHDLAETLPVWAKEIAPVAETVAHVLGQSMEGKFVLATPLTRSRTRSAQAVVKARKAAAKAAAQTVVARQRMDAQPVLPMWSCPGCGGAVTNPRHVRCEQCIDADPAQSPDVRGRRGAAIAARKKAIRSWEQANIGASYDPELFQREILPRLATIKLSAMVEATGMSKSFASQVRSGEHMPHVSTWAALAELVGLSLDGHQVLA